MPLHAALIVDIAKAFPRLFNTETSFEINVLILIDEVHTKDRKVQYEEQTREFIHERK